MAADIGLCRAITDIDNDLRFGVAWYSGNEAIKMKLRVQ
jgi:hypothetical protein